MELVKKNIHMNRWKGYATSQITLDDDFIVPDSMDDVDQIILSSGEITIDSVKNQTERVTVRGKLDFTILYRGAEGGLQALPGSITFEEPINVPGLEEKDFVQLIWDLEDLNAGIINSRKLNVKAIVTLQIKVETIYDVDAAVEVDTGSAAKDAPLVETLRRNMDVAAIALRHKDTFRIKDTVTLSGNKPNIDHILWTEMKLRGVTTRPVDGKMMLDGEMLVFVIYQGEGEGAPIQWVEESIPFSGELSVPDLTEDMVPSVTVHLIHKDMEAKPDADGEMREMDVDAVLELDMKLYKEDNMELLCDLYSTNRELTLQTGEACFDKILTKNMSKCKIVERVSLENADRILQICHSEGTVKIDETTVKDDGLLVEGVLEVRILFLTSDDVQPIQSSVENVPFHFMIEAPGINEDTVCQLNSGLEQLSAVMMGGGMIEVKATISLDLLALQPVCVQIIINASEAPLDLIRLQKLPGIVGYIVQPEDSLWKIAKKFHTTIDTIMAANGLTDKAVKPGDRLILVKELS
ncbi:SPOCS domain-containing protein [Lachnospiraceae bacterium 54-53]